jgi:hypothetical protein
VLACGYLRGCWVQGAWCRVQGAWCRVQGAGCCAGCWVPGAVPSGGCWVLGAECWVLCRVRRCKSVHAEWTVSNHARRHGTWHSAPCAAPRTLPPHPAPCTRHPAPCTRHPAPGTRVGAPRTRHPAPDNAQSPVETANWTEIPGKTAQKPVRCPDFSAPPARGFVCPRA